MYVRTFSQCISIWGCVEGLANKFQNSNCTINPNDKNHQIDTMSLMLVDRNWLDSAGKIRQPNNSDSLSKSSKTCGIVRDRSRDLLALDHSHLRERSK